MNDSWKEILKELAGKLTAGLAFAIIFSFMVLQFTDFDEGLIFIIAGIGYLGYFIIELSRARQRTAPEKEALLRSQEM